MWKRLLGLVVAVVMVMGVGMVVFAEDEAAGIVLSPKYQGVDFASMNLLEYASYFVGDENLPYTQSNGDLTSDLRLEYRASVADQKHRKADGTLDYNWVACNKKDHGADCKWYKNTSCPRMDCSKFVQCVMAHCGISVPDTTTGYYNDLFGGSSKYPNLRVVPDEEAMPGDVVLWYDAVNHKGQHVALYIGESEIIHISSSHDRSTTERNDTLITRRGLYTMKDYVRVMVRVVDDADAFNSDGTINPDGVFGDIDSVETKRAIQSKPIEMGDLVMEGDLVGMETVWCAGEQDMIHLLSRDSLGVKDRVSLTAIGDGIESRVITMPEAVGVISSGLGIVLMVYGFIVMLAGIFDKVNQFIDVSLVKIVSFGKWYIVDDENLEGNKKGKHFISMAGFVLRIVILVGTGIFLVSGLFVRMVVWLFGGLFV